jgi:hypothetical protein
MAEKYLVTHAAEDLDRIVLISEAEAKPFQREMAIQTIVADHWVDARCKISTAGIYHDEGFGWRLM